MSLNSFNSHDENRYHYYSCLVDELNEPARENLKSELWSPQLSNHTLPKEAIKSYSSKRGICFLCLFPRAPPLWLMASGGGRGVCICSPPFAPCLASDAEHLSQAQASVIDDAFPPKTFRKSWKLVGPKNSFIHPFVYAAQTL